MKAKGDDALLVQTFAETLDAVYSYPADSSVEAVEIEAQKSCANGKLFAKLTDSILKGGPH
jgi:hypothetical protein